MPLLLGLCGLLAVLLLRALLLRWVHLYRGRRRQSVAYAGERRALGLLERAGYRILETQARRDLRVKLDGQVRRYEVRADLIVERMGRRYVAEVKTGELAPDLRHGPTRRQLLEYALAYPVDGAVLVDVPARRVRRVEFPVRGRLRLPRLILLVVLGIALGLWLRDLPQPQTAWDQLGVGRTWGKPSD